LFVLAEKIQQSNSFGERAKLYEIVEKIQYRAKLNTELYETGQWKKPNIARNGKKKSLKNLPDDWTEKVIHSFNGHKYFDAVKVLACCGARPAEIDKGIRISRSKDGIHFHINGSKVDGVRGQFWREILFPLDHPIASTIADGRYKAGARLISEAITRKGNNLNYVAVSAYSFRHQLSSDLKASGFKKKDIAKALGHQSTAAQEGYGNSGAGRKIEADVYASQEPRSSAKAPKNSISGIKLNVNVLIKFSVKSASKLKL